MMSQCQHEVESALHLPEPHYQISPATIHQAKNNQNLLCLEIPLNYA